MPRAVRRAPALLGAESRPGVGLSALDLARLEDAGAGCLDRLERRATAAQPPVDREQWPISDPASGASQRAGQQNPGTERPANAARLGDPLWVSSPAAGNASGSDSFSWDMLPGCQLDLYRANRRTRASGPRAQSSWSGGQRHLCLSAGARRATAAKRQSHTVNKYEFIIPDLSPERYQAVKERKGKKPS